MKNTIAELIIGTGNLTLQDIALQIFAAAIVSIAIYISYWYTHTGTAYSRKFNVSLVTLTILTATAMTVIANNIALSLGMVGALSIVRFRTAIKDSRDTTYIFWAIVVGICCGAGDYIVAGIGSGLVFLFLLILGRVRNENRILLVIRGQRSLELELEGVVAEYFNNKAVMKVKNTSPDNIEMIYEMSAKTYKLMYKKEKSITERLYEFKNVECVNIISQSDEITG